MAKQNGKSRSNRKSAGSNPQPQMQQQSPREAARSERKSGSAFPQFASRAREHPTAAIAAGALAGGVAAAAAVGAFGRSRKDQQH